MRYAERNPKVREILAAQYRPGEPFDELMEVARKCWHEPRLAVVPELRVLLVQTRTADGEDLDYDVVEDHGWLVYSPGSSVMYTLTDEEFRESGMEAVELRACTSGGACPGG